jgi:cyclophilin family peptidyl-prolyl cis-trans isomerase
MKMKPIKLVFTICAFTLMFVATSCNDDGRYPDLKDGIYAEIVTNIDTMVAKLYYIKAPVTVANFVALAEGVHPMVKEEFKGKKFYNGLIFHRVMDQFMIQGGDPEGSGRGGPGYVFEDEFDKTLRHDRPGILSMANGGPNGNGSQFFITEVPTPWLDDRHSIFGELVIGLDVQDSISNVSVEPGSNKPIDSITIKEVNIIRKGFDARKYDAAKAWETELPRLKEKIKAKQEEERKNAVEAKRLSEEKMNEAAAEILPTLKEYKSKATNLPSGLMEYVISKGTGSAVKQGDNVTVNYEGYFTDGKLFDSNRQEVEEKFGKFNQMKVDRGMYNPMPMVISPDAQMIAGFKEACASMKVGEKKYAYIPSHLAYGERGRGMIQPNTDLIFLLEIVSIE